MVENMPTAVILANTDLVIDYINPASRGALKKLEQYLPCRASEVVGRSVDIFHKNPAHQRRILQDPNNLPHRATIQVGPEKLDLLVSATRDDQNRLLFQRIPTASSIEICGDYRTGSCVNLFDVRELVENYILDVPVDPLSEDPDIINEHSRYFIIRTSQRFTITAPDTEPVGSEDLDVTR